VVTAHRFAIASEHVTSDMVEVSEFPDVAQKDQVRGVPKTVINDKHEFIGAMPELEVAQAVLRAIGR
jgi:predicted DsbA family dithiol-disulfide isomerase